MKIAFVDIDGTILDYSKAMRQPTERLIKAFARFREQGNILICATSRGRLPQGVKEAWFDGFVLNNGQYVAYHDAVLLNNAFNKDQVEFLAKTIRAYGGGCSFQGVAGNWVSPYHKELTIAHGVRYGLDPAKADEHYLPFIPETIVATASTASFNDPEKLRQAYEALPKEWEVHVYYDPSDLRMDIHLPGHTKGSSCMLLVNHLGLDRSSSYAFGDGINDIEMLELVGTGVAMGNAGPEVKAIADEHTDDVLDDGLAKAFERLFDL